MNIYHNILREDREKQNRLLIFENVYMLEIFQNLINYCWDQILYHTDVVYIDYKKLMFLLPKNLNFKKYFNKNKSLFVLAASNYTNQCRLNLTRKEILEINEKFTFDKGLFLSDFDNDKTNSLLILKDSLYEYEFKNVFLHEIIHFVQWSTGKTIKSLLKDKQYNISNDDKLEIKNILNLDVEKYIKYISNPKELEAYCNTIFYELKYFCIKNDLPFTREFISLICDVFKNNFCSFKKYYENILTTLKDLNLEILLKFDSIIILMLIGYFKIGYNTFKSHIYFYFDKSN